MLSTCALNPRQYRRGLEIGVDIGLLDLEDSVPPDRREEARGLALPFLADTSLRERPAGFTWALRINSLRIADGLRDVIALIESGARPDVVLLAKVDSAEEVLIYDQLLGPHLPEVGFLPIVETGRGLAAAEEIAGASPRVRMLIFGTADFSVDVGSTMGWEPLFCARSRLVAAAARAGLPVMDGPCFEVHDPEALERDIERARRLGFCGKVAIHPSQVAAINQGFGRPRPVPAPRSWMMAEDV